MGTWRQRGRLAVIAAATFVLLVVVLPQVAGGLGLGSVATRLESSAGCSSGSSGSSGSAPTSGSSSSSQCGSQTGSITGKVKVTGAPKGFAPAFLGVGACPASESTDTQLCPSPQYELSSDGRYSLTLTAGQWRIGAFYELAAFGGAFLGEIRSVDVAGGSTVVRNLTVAYRAPATVTGTVEVTGVPKRIHIESYSALLCPSYAPYTGGNVPIVCVDSGDASSPKTPYSIDTLPPGTWVAYPQYLTEFGFTTNPAAGVTVELKAGATTTADLTTPYLVPADGIVSATVTVTGAPTGFSDPLAVQICSTGGNEGFCSISGGFTSEPSNTTTVSQPLTPGTYTATGIWLASPFYNEIEGPSKTVTVTAGKVSKVELTVAYASLATATGTIHIRHRPGRVEIEDYTVLACPASSPWNGVAGDYAVGCVSEYSGYGGELYEATDSRRMGALKHPAWTRRKARAPYDTYDLTTLTAGSWILYPGYVTVFGSYVDPVGTTIQVTAGGTTKTNLTVRYQQPTVGALEGRVAVTGSPEYNPASVGVEVCTAPPTATSCPGEQVTYVDQDGDYQLAVPPGTWWAAGIAQIYGPDGPVSTVGPATSVSISAGVVTKANFIVAAT